VKKKKQNKTKQKKTKKKNRKNIILAKLLLVTNDVKGAGILQALTQM